MPIIGHSKVHIGYAGWGKEARTGLLKKLDKFWERVGHSRLKNIFPNLFL
jgi:hypothetical protein